jgi:HNH endonuclease
MELSQQLLKEALYYDPETGLFTWRKDRPTEHFKTLSAYKTQTTKLSGKIAGHSEPYSDNLNYIQIRIFGRLYLAHRLAWLYVHGKWPENKIDHFDGNGENNKFTNLREVDSPTNGRNCVLSKNNTSGVNGVYWDKRSSRWIAEGTFYTEDGKPKKKYIGSFSDLEKAKIAREAWQLEQGGFTERHGKNTEEEIK